MFFYYSEMGFDIIAVIVGSAKVRFSLHKQLLFAVAPIFEEHISGFSDGTLKITLADEFPGMFRLFVNYGKSSKIAY